MVKKQKVDYRISLDEFNRFTEEFRNESDRAAVILGASQLDILLYQLIERFLLPNPSSKDELLDGDSPLATFSSRISICYRLGLINADFSRALHLIRKIRNSFAHEVSGVSFETGGHRDRVRELIAPFAPSNQFNLFVEKYYNGAAKPGEQFRAVVAMLSLRLDGAIERVAKVKCKETINILPPEIDDEEFDEKMKKLKEDT